MKTTYSILYTPIKTIGQERLNLGMIMIDDYGNIQFDFAKEKLKASKKLFDDDGYKLLVSYLNAIETKLSKKDELIDSRSKFNTGYLDYLSNYSNNLLSFSKPVDIDIDLSDSNFNHLFSKYIFKRVEVEKLTPLKSRIDSLKLEVLPRVKERVNVNVDLDADTFDFVMFNMRIDMMGRNDMPVLNQFIDFETSNRTIQKQLTDYLSIVKPLELREKKPGKFFIVADEPSKKEIKQHLIWRHLMDSPLISEKIVEVAPTNEIGRIEDYLKEHDVKPFFE
ncbi:hypothetical protein [Ekhidna sp.]|uniref:hypothetical protein n=1 Tax=Ekhidna sp. TaxID=2608089 RepID=UPI003CCB96B3